MENVSSTIGVGVEVHWMNGEWRKGAPSHSPFSILLSPFSYLHIRISFLMCANWSQWKEKSHHIRMPKWNNCTMLHTVKLFHENRFQHSFAELRKKNYKRLQRTQHESEGVHFVQTIVAFRNCSWRAISRSDLRRKQERLDSQTTYRNQRMQWISLLDWLTKAHDEAKWCWTHQSSQRRIIAITNINGDD